MRKGPEMNWYLNEANSIIALLFGNKDVKQTHLLCGANITDLADSEMLAPCCDADTGNTAYIHTYMPFPGTEMLSLCRQSAN